MKLVREVFRNRKVEGDLGVEVEVEGERIPRFNNEHWVTVHDGSLRGESAEYVFPGPKSLRETRESLLYLADRFKANDSQVYNTGRAGVHVHVNCQELTIPQLYSFFTLYTILEEVLVQWCGDDRVGNLFCLRSADAELPIFYMWQAIAEDDFRVLGTDDLRYASMNVKALHQYGSVEFRAMSSTGDVEDVYVWAKTLYHLRKFAEEADNPEHFIYQVSAGGEEAFVDQFLPFLSDAVKVGDWQQLVKNGMRRAQEIAFSCNWAEYGKVVRVVGDLEVDEDWDDDFPPVDY